MNTAELAMGPAKIAFCGFTCGDLNDGSSGVARLGSVCECNRSYLYSGDDAGRPRKYREMPAGWMNGRASGRRRTVSVSQWRG